MQRDLGARTRAAALVAITALFATPAIAQPPAKPDPAPPKTIVLVHGAFADGSSWDRVVPLLLAKGYNVIAVHEPLSSLADDVAATTRAIEQAPGDVVLVGHSYGGVVITEAGNHDKVKALVYVAAFAPDAGESASDLGKGKAPAPWRQKLKVDSGGYAWLPVESVLGDFVQDLPAAEAKVIAAKQGPISAKNFDAKVTTAAWKTKPSYYLRAEQDRIIDPAGQAATAKRMNANLTSIKSAHVPMMSKPKEVAAVIISAATAPTVSKR